MRALPRCLRIVCLGLLIAPMVCLGDDGDEPGLTKELHPWGRFDKHKGAWKRYRVVTETLDDNGQVVNTSVTETKTSLEDVDTEGVTLRVEAIVEIAGKRLPAEPKVVRQSLRGDWASGRAKVRTLGPGEVTIEGRVFPCRVEEAEISTPNGTAVTRTYFSRFVPPYVLRRESKTTAPDGKTIEDTAFRVVSLDRPCKIVPRIRRAAWVEAVSTTANGTTVTRAFTTTEVPGGVVCHTADEMDAKGRLVRHSNLLLVDFGLEPEKDDSDLPNRLRARSRRTHRSGS
jgi:hypothetical protein